VLHKLEVEIERSARARRGSDDPGTRWPKGEERITCAPRPRSWTPYEWAEDGKPYREFLVPAELLNGRTLSVVEDW